MRTSSSVPLFRLDGAPAQGAQLLQQSFSSGSSPEKSAVEGGFDIGGWKLPSPTAQRNGAGGVEERGRLRGGQILLPSGGSANDAARSRNGGRRLVPKALTQRVLSPKGRMAKSASDSALFSLSAGISGANFTLTNSASATALEPKTPRTIRGMVRKTSAVQIGYYPVSHSEGSSPVGRWGSGSVARAAQTCRERQPLNDTGAWILEGSRKDLDGRPNTAGNSPTYAGKRVSWADRVGEELGSKTQGPSLNVIVKEGTPSAHQIKSKKLMEGLFKLRRVGGADASPRDTPTSPDGSEAPTTGETAEDEEQLTLLNSTLSSVDDLEAALRLTQAMLLGAHEPVAELGGARHATTLVSGRTLSVVKRKADLCQWAEAHLAAFQAADATKEALRDALVAGDAEIPSGYRGQKRFIAAMIHRNHLGLKMNPVDAERAPFEVFAVSFLLPPEHVTLMKTKSLAIEATEWWAEETLQEAYRGSSSYVLQRLIGVTIGFLDIGETGHEKLVQVKVVLGDRLAEKVLDIAEKLSVKDAQVVERSEAAQPDHARKVADEIDAEIKEAVALGAPNKHPKLAAAKQIAVRFHLEEFNRWALKALQFAHKKRAEDKIMVEKAGDKVPPVGPGSDAGDAIEKQIGACAKQGAPEEHPRMMEAKQIMKWLRDQDGERKRMAAREKRLAEAAARKAEGG